MLDPGNLPGKTASLDFGEMTELEKERKAVESAGSPAAPQGQPGAAGPPGAPPEPGNAGGPPVQPAPMTAPIAPPVDARPIDARIDTGNLFQQAPELREPWRTWLRRVASHPQAGPELRALADAIEHQRGPLDGAPK